MTQLTLFKIDLKRSVGWPVTDGRYLFWGKRFRSSSENNLFLVRVATGASGQNMIVNDNFAYEGDFGEGVFYLIKFEGD